jgi:hypothetical protein
MTQTLLDQRVLGLGTDLSDHTITASDIVSFADVGASNVIKRDTVQGVLDLAGGGKLISRKYDDYLSETSLTTTIPQDDSVPTSSEGTELMSVATGTLASSSNRIRVSYGGYAGSSGTGVNVTAALFVGGAAAVHVASHTTGQGDYFHPIVGAYEYAPGATTGLTVSLRVGPQSGTLYTNANTSTRAYGGVFGWWMIVEEIEP